MMENIGYVVVAGLVCLIAGAVWWYVHNKRKHPGKVEGILERTGKAIDEMRK